MPTFRIKSGLSQYGLHCGYMQIAQFKGYRVELRHSGGAVYDVLTFDPDLGNGRRWESFENLTDARKDWEKECRRVFAPELNWFKCDGRYRVALEFCGDDTARWVSRFCGGWLGKHDTRTAAILACRDEYNQRFGG